jgi:hypothetical protein
MQTINFKDWTLTTLDETFGLKQVWGSDLLKKWQKLPVQIDDFETKTLLNLQKTLIRGGKAWNEVELENKFISPLIMTAQIDDESIGYFLERPLKSIVGNFELSGIVDGIIASGFREPKKPFFCLKEYKKSIDNQGSPDAQALAAMLVAKELNNNQKPIYGVYVVGLIWNFMVLHGHEYCISNDYKADNEEVFEIFKMIKAIKNIIQQELMK